MRWDFLAMLLMIGIFGFIAQVCFANWLVSDPWLTRRPPADFTYLGFAKRNGWTRDDGCLCSGMVCIVAASSLSFEIDLTFSLLPIRIP